MSAELHRAGTAGPVRCRVRLIKTGMTSMPPAYVYRDAGGGARALGVGVPSSARIPAPIGAALIEHPRHGPVLVDSGMHAVVATRPERNLGRLGAAVLRVRMRPGEDAATRLTAWGIAPEAVERVVMTHLHADHTSAMAAFPGATFVIAAAEWRAARRRFAAANGYAAAHLPPLERVALFDFGAAVPHESLGQTIDWFGDGSVRLVATPGHTPGHLSVLVEGGRGPVFLLGDAVYTLRNLREDVLPWRTADDEQSKRSVREIAAYAAHHPGVPLVPTHDADVWERLEGIDL